MAIATAVRFWAAEAGTLGWVELVVEVFVIVMIACA